MGKSSLALVAGLLFVSTQAASAASILIGVFDGNVNETPASLLEVQTLAADPSITLYSKSDLGGGPYAGSKLTITGIPGTSGTWDVVEPSVLISYYVVKASDQFALYRVLPASNSGEWNTFAIPYNQNPHNVSHLTFYLASIPQDPGVPEPSTSALLAGGIGALLLLRHWLACRLNK